MLKAVILDFNGVFIKSEYLADRIEKKYGIPGDKFYVALKKVLDMTRKPGAEDFFKLIKLYLEELNFSISRKEFYDFWFTGEKLVPEVLEYVKKLRVKGVKVFILSRNFRERTVYFRNNFPEVFNNIDKAYFSWETGFVKPDQRAYKQVLEENHLKPEECIYFDDSEENIEAAKKLGIKAYKFKGLDGAIKIIGV
jgi:putative hydrolase of the HAD superfamily